MRAPRLTALTVLALLSAAHLAVADGMFMPPEEEYGRVYGDLGAASTEQKGIVIELPGGREVLLLQTTYHGPAAGFAWIVPVPGEPREDDVFIASSEFISHLLDTTAPRVETHIETPAQRHYAGEDGIIVGEAPPPGALMGGMEPSVTVHRRMEVGDYDVSVLSATGPHVLIDWLNDNGYATPTQHADVIDHYVQKHWYFVALRVLPSVVEDRPVLDDVKPIGIEFAADELVYPLYISRASSRQKTALTLVALTAEPVECEQLHRAHLPLDQEFEPGTHYAAIRREIVEKALQRPATILEYAGYGGFAEPDLHWLDERWPDEGDPDPCVLWATRWWTILDVEEMADLTLEPATVAGSRLVVKRHGRLPGPPLLQRLRLPAAPVAAALFLLLALAGGWTRRVPPELRRAALIIGAAGVLAPHLPPGAAILALILAVLLTIVIVAALVAGEDSAEAAERLGWWSALLWAALAAGWASLAGLAGDQSGMHYALWHGRAFGMWPLLGAAGWALLLVGVVAHAWPRWRGERRSFVVATLVISVPLSMFTHSLFRFARPWQLASGVVAALSLATLVGCTAVLIWLAATGRLRLLPRASRVRLVTWLVISACVLLILVAAVRERVLDVLSPTQALESLMTLATAALLAFAWIAIRADAPGRRAATAFALTLLILGTAVAVGRFTFTPPAYGGMMVARNSGLSALDSALIELDDALLSFVGDTGCYPASVDDLTATAAPAVGLDSSGNRVELRGEFRGPYLRQLPEDPLTAKRDTWLYEVTGAPMIDSGGLTITLRREATPPLDQVKQSLRSSGRPVSRYPFEPVSAGWDAINAHPEGALGQLVFDRYGGELLLADVSARTAARLPLVPPNRGRPDAICLSPDGRRVAFANNRERSTHIAVCDVFYETHTNERGARWSAPGQNYVRLLSRPWRVNVLDIAWHPTEDRWAVLTGDYTEEGRQIHAWLVDGESHPREVASLAHEAGEIRWAPDGQSLYVIARDDDRVTSGANLDHAGLTRAVARQIGLDGTTGDALSTYRELFVSNRYGVAYSNPSRQEIDYIAPDGASGRPLRGRSVARARRPDCSLDA